jgi:hypothetical protein
LWFLFVAKSEYIVGVLEDHAAFGFGEFTFGIAQSGEVGTGLGAGVLVPLKLEGFPAGAGQGVDHAGEGPGVAAQFVVQGSRGQVAEGLEDVKRADLESGLVDAGGVEVVDEFASGFEVDADLFDPMLVEEPVLMAAAFPGGDVLFGNGVWERRVGGGLEGTDDFAVG